MGVSTMESMLLLDIRPALEGHFGRHHGYLGLHREDLEPLGFFGARRLLNHQQLVDLLPTTDSLRVRYWHLIEPKRLSVPSRDLRLQLHNGQKHPQPVATQSLIPVLQQPATTGHQHHHKFLTRDLVEACRHRHRWLLLLRRNPQRVPALKESC